ncbi:MAG: hypothetical protein U5M23_05835 [Marinagarivorans sp.]|nr:hypothetical protein [Marinagarivorans sp.]
MDTIELAGKAMGLISVVPFIDVDFTSAVFRFQSSRWGKPITVFTSSIKIPASVAFGF